ncbi:unnamed protein product [Ectocarpus sp. CCAP 1310/34]|nr:unnamed protein product [Ectocarpus sp. CCAP 1310/34]
MATFAANEDIYSARKSSLHPSKNPQRPIRRRRSRSWQVEMGIAAGEPSGSAPAPRASGPITIGDRTMLPSSGPAVVERRKSLDSTRLDGFGSEEAAAGSAAAPSARVSNRKWFSAWFLGKKRMMSLPSSSQVQAADPASSLSVPNGGKGEGVGPSLLQRAGVADAPKKPIAGADAMAKRRHGSGSSSSSSRRPASGAFSRRGSDAAAKRKSHTIFPGISPMRPAGAATATAAAAAAVAAAAATGGVKARQAGAGAAEDEDTLTTPPPAARPCLPSCEARRRTPAAAAATPPAATTTGRPPRRAGLSDSDTAEDADAGGQARAVVEGEPMGRDSSSEDSLRGGRAAEIKLIATGLEPGTELLYLDIFISATGGDEIRQWRPAEVAEIVPADGGGLQARVVFASYAEEKQSVYLHLEHEWSRLAPTLSLTEEEMARGASLSGEALAASQKRYKPPRANPPGRREGGSRHAAGLHDGARSAAGRDHRQPDGDGGGSVERPLHQRQREELASEDIRDGGGFGGAGGGCSNTTDVAKVTAALKLVLAAEQGGDTSSSSGGGSRHGGGVSAAEDRPADGGATASADGLPAPTADPPPLQEMRVQAEAATKAAGGGAEDLPAAVPRRGGGGSARIRRFFGGEEPAVESATAAAPRPDCPAKETMTTNGLQSAAEERGAEAMAAGAGEQGASKRRVGSGRVRKGKQRGGRAAGTGARKKPAWTLWDLAKPPTVGDRFDCLDYFVSSQTGLSAEKWRGAEVMDVRHANKGTQVLVRFLKRNSKWDRWISLSQEPERFAPYQSHAPKVAEKAGGAELLASERAHQDNLGSAGESSSTASTATMTNSSASSIGTLGGGGGGFTGGLGSAGAKEDEDAIAGLSDPALSKSRVLRSRTHSDLYSSRSPEPPPAPAPAAPPRARENRGTSGRRPRSQSPAPTHNAAAPQHSGGGGSRDGSRRGSTGGSPARTAAATAAPAGGVRARGPSSVAARGGGSGGRGSPTGGSGEDSEEAAVERAFREAMRRTGLSVVDVEPDGNCLFRSVSHQIYGDADRHYPVRKACVEHMYRHRARFGVFVAEDFRDYLFRIRQPGVWGDDLEIRALEEMFDRPIEIYSSESEGLQPMKIDFDASGLDMGMAPIKLSYHGQSHYNSVRDFSLRYPLHPRRSKRILQIREAQHAHTPGSAVPASLSRPGGGKAGSRGVGVIEKSCNSRFAGFKESATSSFCVGGGSARSGRGGEKRSSGGGGARAGGGKGTGGGGGAKNLAGMALRTLFGGVSGRVAT